MIRSALRSIARAVLWLPRRLLDLLPGPPDGSEPADPLLADIEQLPPEEQRARRQAWLAQMRRGRGDGNG